jgi:hypothetical protein
MADNLIDAAQDELDQAIGEWNDLGEHLTPDGRIRLAEVYALVSIARSLDRLADGQAAAPLQQPY